MAPHEAPFHPESVLVGSFGRKVIDEAQRMAQERELPGQWTLEAPRHPTLLSATTMHNVRKGSNDPWKVVRIDCDTGLMTARPVGSDWPRVDLVPSLLKMQVRESGLVEVTVELTRGVHMRVVRALFGVDGGLREIGFGIAGGPYGLQQPIGKEQLGPTPFGERENPRKRITMSEPVPPPSSCRGSTSKVNFSKRVTHDLGFGARVESLFEAGVGDFGEDGKDSLRVVCPDQRNDPAVTMVRSLPTHFAGGPEALRWLLVEELDRVMRDIPPAPPKGAPSPGVPPADAAAVAVAAGSDKAAVG